MELTLKIEIKNKETGALVETLYRDTWFPCRGPKTVKKVLAPKISALEAEYPGCSVHVHFPRPAD